MSTIIGYAVGKRPTYTADDVDIVYEDDCSKIMTNTVGMAVYYSPTGKRMRARRVSIFEKIMFKRRKPLCDMEKMRRWHIT